MTTTTLERTEGLSVLNQAMTAIKERIEEKRGVFNVQMEVRNFQSIINVLNSTEYTWSLIYKHKLTRFYTKMFFKFRPLRIICGVRFLNKSFFCSAQSGHRHRWNRTAAAAGAFGARECRGGRWWRRGGNGSQNRGLDEKTDGVWKPTTPSLQKWSQILFLHGSGQSVTLQQINIYTSENIIKQWKPDFCF